MLNGQPQEVETTRDMRHASTDAGSGVDVVGVGGGAGTVEVSQSQRLEAARLAARKVLRAVRYLDPQDVRQEAALIALEAPDRVFLRTPWYAKEWVRGMLLARTVGRDRMRKARENEYARDLPSPTTLAARANNAKMRENRGARVGRKGGVRTDGAQRNDPPPGRATQQNQAA